MAFSTDSGDLFYDALSQVRFGGGPAAQRWSIFSLHLATGKIATLVAPQDGVDFGNPAVGHASTRFLAYDSLETASGVAAVIMLDLSSGQNSKVGTVTNGWGFPSFLGDDTGLIFAAPDPNASSSGASLFRQDLTSDRLHTQGAPRVWYKGADLGIIYRRGTSQPANTPPTVTLKISADQVTSQDSVILTATASDSDGTIAKVEFYDGSVELGTIEQAPYVFTWKNPTPGNHLLTAHALDNSGAATTSSPRFLTVSSAPGPRNDAVRVSIRAMGPGTVRLTVGGPPGYYVISMSDDLKTWVDIYGVIIDANGTGTGSIDDSGGPLHYSHLFYQARPD
jgi:hypothetical protein